MHKHEGSLLWNVCECVCNAIIWMYTVFNSFVSLQTCQTCWSIPFGNFKHEKLHTIFSMHLFSLSMPRRQRTSVLEANGCYSFNCCTKYDSFALIYTSIFALKISTLVKYWTHEHSNGFVCFCKYGDENANRLSSNRHKNN